MFEWQALAAPGTGSRTLETAFSPGHAVPGTCIYYGMKSQLRQMQACHLIFW